MARALVFQIPPALEQRGVFYKQSKAGFYPTSCYVVADTLVNTILTVWEHAFALDILLSPST